MKMKLCLAASVLTLSSYCLVAAGPDADTQTGHTTVPGIEVGPSVHATSASPAWRHGEFAICADPTSPLELTIGSMYRKEGVNFAWGGISYYVTHDGGKTWSLGLETEHRADPACAYGPDGTIYAVTMFGQG